MLILHGVLGVFIVELIEVDRVLPLMTDACVTTHEFKHELAILLVHILEDFPEPSEVLDQVFIAELFLYNSDLTSRLQGRGCYQRL